MIGTMKTIQLKRCDDLGIDKHPEEIMEERQRRKVAVPRHNSHSMTS